MKRFQKIVLKDRVFLLLILMAMILVLIAGNAFSASINDGFDPNANNEVYSIAVQADGKILVGGEFTVIG